jgi:Lipocalin-like domain
MAVLRIRFGLSKVMGALLVLLPLFAHAQVSKEQIIGTWKLTWWTRLVGDAEEPGPLGPGAIGFIMYTTDGYMCGNAMRPDRPKFTSRDFRAGSPEEKAGAFESYFGYCGRYQVDESNGVVTHTVEVSSFPNFTGTEQKRFVTVDGDRMKITTPSVQIEGKPSHHILLWERAK